MKTRLLIWVLPLLMLSGQACADGLTSETVARFMQSMNEVRGLSATYGEPEGLFEQEAASGELGNMAAPFTSSIGQMRAYAGYDAMVDVLEAHGFEGVEQWAGVGDRVMRAYMALQIAEQMPDVDAQMAQAMREIENSNMPAEQKQMMRDMMQSSNKMMEAYADVPESDKAAVRPHMGAFESIE